MDDTQVKVISHFNAAHEAILKGVTGGVRAVAFAIQAEAIDKITDRGLVDTGALRRSVYVEAEGVDQRAKALADAIAFASKPGTKSKKGHKIEEAQPFIGPRVQTGPTAKIGVCVNYGIYLEMGTVKMAARPFMSPASQTIMAKAQKIMNSYVHEALKGSI